MDNPPPTAEPPFPPPPPAPLPPPPPASPKSSVPVWILVGGLAGGLLLVFAIAAALLLPALAKAKQKAQNIQSRRAAAAATATRPAPLSEQQRARLAEFGAELADRIQKSDGAWIGARMDFDTFIGRTLTGLNPPAGFEASFRRELRMRKGVLLSEVLGASAHFRGIGQKDGFPTVSLRLQPGEGMMFVEVLVRPAEDSFKMVDLYNHVFAMLTSQESGIVVGLLSQGEHTGLAGLLGVKASDVKDLTHLRTLQKTSRSGNFAGAVAAYDALPQAFHDTKVALALLLTSLQNLPDPASQARFRRELERAASIVGPENAISLLEVDVHFANEDFTGAARAISDTMKVVGRDGHLLQMQGFLAAKTGDLPQAESCLAEAVQLEPDLAELFDLRIAVRCLKKEYAAAMEDIRAFEKKHDIRLPADTFDDTLHDGLRQSREYKAWAAEPR